MAEDDPQTIKRSYAESMAFELQLRHPCCMQLKNESAPHECTELAKEIESSLRAGYKSLEDRLPKVKGGKYKLYASMVVFAVNALVDDDIKSGVRAASTRLKRQIANMNKQEADSPAKKVKMESAD